MRFVLLLFLLEFVSVSAYTGGKQWLAGCTVDGDCGPHAVCHYGSGGSTYCSCTSDAACPFDMTCYRYPFTDISACKCKFVGFGVDTGCPANWRCGLPSPLHSRDDVTIATGDGNTGCLCDSNVPDNTVPCGGLGHGNCVVTGDGFNSPFGAHCECRTAEGWTGPDCSVDTCASTHCSDHGRCLCSAGAPEIRSINDGSFVGYNCSYSDVCKRDNSCNSGRMLGLACQCNDGYIPDTGGGGLCSGFLACGHNGVMSADPTNAGFTHCECTNDYYLYATRNIQTPYACRAGCGEAICSGHGSCVSKTTGSYTTNYNSDCACQQGWRTDPNLVTSTFWTGVYCSVPYLTIDSVRFDCGVYGTYQGGFVPGCVCNSAPQIATDPVSGLCVNQCLTYQGQTCGGPKRGVCVSDQVGGNICECKTGFSGYDCGTVVCPLTNGDPCSSNGVCDLTSARCICFPGFVGLNCQIRDGDCDKSQVVKSYPTSYVSV